MTSASIPTENSCCRAAKRRPHTESQSGAIATPLARSNRCNRESSQAVKNREVSQRLAEKAGLQTILRSWSRQGRKARHQARRERPLIS
jgi:hypothetical protein